MKQNLCVGHVLGFVLMFTELFVYLLYFTCSLQLSIFARCMNFDCSFQIKIDWNFT